MEKSLAINQYADECAQYMIVNVNEEKSQICRDGAMCDFFFETANITEQERIEHFQDFVHYSRNLCPKGHQCNKRAKQSHRLKFVHSEQEFQEMTYCKCDEYAIGACYHQHKLTIRSQAQAQALAQAQRVVALTQAPAQESTQAMRFAQFQALSPEMQRSVRQRQMQNPVVRQQILHMASQMREARKQWEESLASNAQSGEESLASNAQSGEELRVGDAKDAQSEEV
jgi:hypothetical protein